jgi:hypothetical protein
VREYDLLLSALEVAQAASLSVNWRNRDVRWMLITGVTTHVLMWVIQAVKDH